MTKPLRVAMVSADERDEFRRWSGAAPSFGMAPNALYEGFAGLPGVEIHLVTCERGEVPDTPKLAENIFFHPVRTSKWGYLRSFYVESTLRIRAAVRRINPDLVHGQGTERYQALGTVFAGKPNLLTIHGNMRAIARELKLPLLSFQGVAARLESLALWKTGGVICNSNYTRHEVEGLARKTWDVPNALNSKYFAPLDGERDRLVRILNVGHIGPRKAQVELLKAARRLFEAGLKFRLEFIGGLNPNIPYGREFHELVSAAEREGWARFLGLLPKEEVIRYMGEARGFIHVPLEEAFGLVVAESMARGLKSFLFGVGGVSDIAAGVPGVEVFRGGDWDGLLSSMAAWIRAGGPAPEDATKLMRERYSPAVVARRHLEVYAELLSAGR